MIDPVVAIRLNRKNLIIATSHQIRKLNVYSNNIAFYFTIL